MGGLCDSCIRLFFKDLIVSGSGVSWVHWNWWCRTTDMKERRTSDFKAVKFGGRNILKGIIKGWVNIL